MIKLILIVLLYSVNLRAFDFDNNQKDLIREIKETNLYSIDITKSIAVSIETDTIKGCQYPNEGLNKGNDVRPVISDRVRVNAILELIKKIIDCEKLPFKEDGQIFLNKEKRLPDMPKGYYREYTLIIPKDGAKEFYIGDTHYTAYPSYGSRGPERIVIGGGSVIYYTPTHYDSFVEINIIAGKNNGMSYEEYNRVR